MLVFDPRVVGHHVEYIGHIIHYVVAKQINHTLHFVVHPRFESHAPELIELVGRYPERVRIHQISRGEYKAIEESATLTRALWSWKVAEKYARSVDADHCLFLELNPLQPILGLPVARGAPFQISGILFFPYVRIEPTHSRIIPQVKAKLERYRKHWQIRWALRNPKLQKIFVLNDTEGAETLNSSHGTNKFGALPDPVPSSEGSVEEERSPFESDGARVHFLLFGSMREHKGIRELIQAMHLLTEEEARQTAVHILGKARDELADELPKLVRMLQEGHPHLQVQYEDRFLSQTELECALCSCDAVLAPYQRTEGSSGVVGHAAKHGKPVIGPNTGLIGTLIQEYQLGKTIDASNPSAIAGAIREALNNPREFSRRRGMQRYVAERSPERFASTVIETLSE